MTFYVLSLVIVVLYCIHSGSRWVGHVPPGIGYQQRDVGGVGAMRTSWESRLPQSFMPPPHMKQMSSLRSNPVWSGLQGILMIHCISYK